MQKQMAKAIPTCAKALDRFSGVVTSDNMALDRMGGLAVGSISKTQTNIANCTFPSLRPPITRESMYEANDVD
jgi:hypothetical protein